MLYYSKAMEEGDTQEDTYDGNCYCLVRLYVFNAASDFLIRVNLFTFMEAGLGAIPSSTTVNTK